MSATGLNLDPVASEPSDTAPTSDPSSLAAGEPPTLRPIPIPRGRAEWFLLVFVVVGRCAFSLQQSIFRLYPDEPGTLAMARWLSGTGDWDMGTSLTWKPGMATLVAPLFWLTDDQETIIRGGLVIGAFAGGLAAIMMNRLTRRLTNLSRRATIVISGLIALSPSSLLSSSYVWGEALVAVAFLGTLVALLRFFDAPRFTTASGAILWAGAGYLSHSRLLPLVVTAALLTAGRFLWGDARRQAALAIALAAVTVVAVDVYASLFYSALWSDPNDANTVSEVAARLGRPLAIAFSASGQIWYLLVSTAGVFGIGVCVLTVRAARHPDQRVLRDARLVIATTLPLIGLSIVFMADRPRADHQIYGRYNDAIVWPVIALGVAWILGAVGPSTWRTGRRRLILFGAIGLAILETMMVTELILQQPRVDDVVVAQMIPGIAGLLPDQDHLHVIAISLIALASTTGVALSTGFVERHRRTTLAVVAIVMLALAVRAHHILEIGDDFASESTAVRELLGPVLEDGEEVVFGFVPEELDPGVGLGLQGYSAQLYQWYLPEIDFRVISDGKYPDDGYAFAPVFDRVLVERGACIVWRDPTFDIVLWDTRPDRCDPPAEGSADGPIGVSRAHQLEQ